MSANSSPYLPTPGGGYLRVDTGFSDLIVPMEKAVLDFWKGSNAFEKLREKNANSSKRFSFLDGPITANNPMGVHHAWGRTLKDAFQRFYAMQGYKLRYQNGFDCQGLWVEVEVEKEKGFKTKDEIREYGIDRFVQDCKDRVIKYSGRQTAQSIRLGMWMDWDNSYFTMSEENNYTIWSFLKKCHQRGKIYRGTDVMPWSGRSGSAYSQMEVIEGRKLVSHRAVFLKFPLTDRPGENLLVWTTTPWTLTSNVAAAVGADLDYACVRCKGDGELYYVAANNLHFQRLERQFKEKKDWIEGIPRLKTLAQLFDDRGGFEIEGRVKGADLLGRPYRGPFDELPAQHVPGGVGLPVPEEHVSLTAAQAHRVIDGGKDSRGADMVVEGEGTGIVHIAPGCGDVDHGLGEKLGLPKLAPLDDRARYIDGFGPLTGKLATDEATVDEILQSLKDKHLLFAVERYPHVYPHCWRTGDELVFRVVDEWYIHMDWRGEILKTVGDIQWIPADGERQERQWLENMGDWMISKKRFWGLALPIWVCEDCDHFDVIGGRDELQARATEGWDRFDGHTPHRPWIDEVKIACAQCGGKAHRVEDVGNPWLDAGIVPYSTTGYNQDRDHWAQWVPADLVLECFPGQFRNWFYSLLTLSTMMEGIAPFKTLLGHALVRDEHGREMHKSWGNAIWFDDAADGEGADTMRWLYVGQEPTVNLNFGYGPLRQVRGKFLNTLWNSYGFYANYARLEGFSPYAQPASALADRDDFDRWIIAELQETIAACRREIPAWNLPAAAAAIEAFVDRLSNWYIRNNRDRFWKSQDAASTRMAFETLFECLEALARLCAPMIPFITEVMYQNLVRAVNPDAPQSVHHCDYPAPDPTRADPALAQDMQVIIRLTSLALSAREEARVKVRQPLPGLTIGPASQAEHRAVARFRDMLKNSLNVKEIHLLEPGAASPLAHRVKPNFKTLGKTLGKLMKAAAAQIQADGPALIQALHSGAAAIPLEVEGQTLTLTPDDLLLEAYVPEGQQIAEEQGTWLALDTHLTPALLQEGLMRDLLRQLQVRRKEIGLELDDRVTLRWADATDALRDALQTWTDYLCAELLIAPGGLQQADALPDGHRLDIGDDHITTDLQRAPRA
jgi:isoleucyl-tRNA synthetase